MDFLSMWILKNDIHVYIYIYIFQGQRSSEKEELVEKIDMPTISLYHEELDSEDYIFRTNIDDL